MKWLCTNFRLFDIRYIHSMISTHSTLSLNKRPGAYMEFKLKGESPIGRRAFNRRGYLLFYLTDCAVVEA